LNQSSYSGYCTKHPFTDSNVTKFELAEALLLVRTSLINSPFRIVQIIDNTGKVLYDNKDTRLSYLN
jgi:uncharacterized membrane protein